MERKHPEAKCEECPLREVGRYVPSIGPAKAELAVVGEAPGVQEARKGIPFAGPTGKLLDIVLKHHGIHRDKILLTNACLCRPPGNETPARSAIRACASRLQYELEERSVDTAIALGNSACESLLGASGVTKLRVGPPKQSALVPSVRVVPTFHPAAALRQSDQFPHIVHDFGKVTHVLPKWFPPEFIVADSELEALELLDQLPARVGEGVLVVDIEVDVEKDTSFDHPSRYGMLCVGLGYGPGRVLVLSEGVMGSEQVRSRLGRVLRGARIVAQNGKFDLAGLYPILGGLELFGDTMLASYAFDERPGIHGLKYMAVEYLGAPQYDDEIKQFVGPGVGYGAIPRPLLYKYNAYDVACTYAMWEYFCAKFETHPEGPDAKRVHDHLVKAANALMYLELNGMAIDVEYNKELGRQFLQELHEIEVKLDALAVGDYDKHGGINPRSPMQIKAYLAAHRIDVDSTDVDTLNYLLEHQQVPEEVKDFVRELLHHRSKAKAHGTYVKGIANRLYRGRVYSTFMLHSTTTGRLSSRNPNVQNITRTSNIRKQFVATRPEHGLGQTDYAQAELRVLSCLAGDQYFRGIFNGGTRDLFDELTPILYPNSEWMQFEDKVGWKELRIRVKAFVYGLGYGRGVKSIAEEYKLSMDEANTLKDNFFSVIPEIVQFQRETKDLVLAGEDLVTHFGRRRHFTLITEQNLSQTMNEALAFLPQSTASDICLRAMYTARPKVKGLGWIRNIVHDSILFEAPWENLPEVQRIVEECMLDSAHEFANGYVKFAVDSKTGKNWSEV